ncbi:MAG TPA: hypothetical protein VMC07_01535 [Candidatus Omnitrophota bacterium]|nr:hypothetical protein [Candidatus Omnitrophota bacterium]
MADDQARIIRMAARHMSRELEQYSALSHVYFEKGNLSEVCYQSEELLHELGEDEYSPEEELEANGDSTRNLIIGLRKLVLAGESSPINKKNVRANYREVMSHLEDVREMLKSVYRR